MNIHTGAHVVRMLHTTLLYTIDTALVTVTILTQVLAIVADTV